MDRVLEEPWTQSQSAKTSIQYIAILRLRGVGGRGNRFIERMYFKVREGVQAGDVEARYINTKLNVSDILTKGAPREVIAVLHGMICGKVPWPDTPDAEGALRAQLLEMWRTRRHDIYFSR